MNLKHTLRDFFIKAAVYSGFVFLYRKIVERKDSLVRVVVFHDVEDKKWFEEVIQMMREKYNIISPDAFHSQKHEREKINILLTFDDGYQSWIDVVLPILEKYNLKGIFFVNSGLLDVANDKALSAEFMQKKLLISPKKPLSWTGAEKLVHFGHTIGGHTVNHAHLSNFNEDVQKIEIEMDRRSIESKLGININDFAYPFGTRRHYNESSFLLAKNAGFTYIYEAEPGFVTSNNLKQSIPRVCFEKNQSLTGVAHWILGGLDVFNFMKRYVRY